LETFSILQHTIRTRRSIRRWLDEGVPRTDLAHMVDCARLAPSDTNAQPWHFTIVTDRTLIRQLADATRQRSAELGKGLEAAGRPEIARKLKVFDKYAAHFGSAPALVIVSGAPYDSRFMREIFAEMLTPVELAQMAQEESIKSTALASMNLLLAAHALGYGAVPMTGPVLMIPQQLKIMLGLLPQFEPHLLIAIGRPAVGQTPEVPRKGLSEVSTWIE
jgi:nitroreductase